MSEIMLGTSGALLSDEKFNIFAFKRADMKMTHLTKNTLFAVADDKGRVMKLGSVEQKTKFRRTFLGAEFKFESDAMPLKVTVRAQTPFALGEDAHLPAVIFSFKLKNTSKKKRTYCIGALIENFLDSPLHEAICVDGWNGVQLSSATSLSIQSDFLTHCFLMDGEASVAGYVRDENPTETFLDMLSSGIMQSSEQALPSFGACSAIARQVSIDSGESKIIHAVYAWYEPNVEWNGARFKNGYIERFDSAVSVAQYLMQNMESYLEFAGKATSAIRASADGKSIEDILLDDLQRKIRLAPIKLVDLGHGKQFYNNRYAAPVVYSAPKQYHSMQAYSFLDIETEANVLQWQAEYGVTSDGIVLPLPAFEDETGVESDPVFSLERQTDYILRWCKLIACPGMKEVLGECWDVLKGVFARLKAELNADVYAMRVWASDGVCDIYKTGMYALACKCMQVLSSFVDDSKIYSFKYTEFVRFMEEYVFNGKYFNDFYPSDGTAADCCSVMPLVPLILGKQLGFDMVSDEKLRISMENTYILNYSDDPENCGLRIRTDAKDVESEAELLFVFGFLEFGKKNLASLLAKVRNFRDYEEKGSLITEVSPLVSAFGSYNAGEQSLRVDKNGFALFLGKTVLLAETKKNITIVAYGEPIVISEIVGFEEDSVKSIICSDTEYMFTQDGETVKLKTPICFQDGEELMISI